MFLRRILPMLLLCSVAQAQDVAQRQHRREFSRTADSLRGPVSAVEIFRRDYRADPGESEHPLRFYCSIRYDSAGNRSHYSSISTKRKYCYDEDGRISGIDFSHATTADYSYDELGHLAEERYI